MVWRGGEEVCGVIVEETQRSSETLLKRGENRGTGFGWLGWVDQLTRDMSK